MSRSRTLVAVAVGVLVLALAGTTAAVLVPGGRERIPLVGDLPALATPADCTVGGVEMDRARAEALTTAVARARLAKTPVRAALTPLLADGDLAPVTRALTGRAKAALTCRVDAGPDATSSRLRGNGLTARADAVRRDVREAFGPVPVGGFAPGGVRTGHQKGSAHYEGRAVDVFFRPISTASKRRGWVLAHYLVAHADRLGVRTVIFDGRIWSRWRSAQGWRSYDIDTGDVPRSTRRILEHRDHVHVDV